jgi:predicted amidohydrolase YtcJ
VRLWPAPASPGPEAEPGEAAVAIEQDRILAVGTTADILDRYGRREGGDRVERLHLPGRLVVPGFQDAHVHPAFAGRYLLHLSLHAASGLADYRRLVAGYAAGHPERPWVYGSGWSVEEFPDGGPHRRWLDDVVPDRPVFLLNSSIHEAWVNSRALELAGITAATPDPPDGRYVRDVDGTPTGHLEEGAAYRFEARHVPRPEPAQWQAAVLAGQRHLHALGVTGWQDAWVEPELLAAYSALAADGRLTGRVSAAQWWQRDLGLEQIPAFVAQRAAVRALGAATLRAGTVKIMVDGVVENGSAALLSPYHCSGHSPGHSPGADHGRSYLDPETLTAAVTELDRLGFQVHLHTIGDRAVRTALDAIEAARRANGPGGNRHHLAHIQVVQPADLARFAELDVTANCQAYWAQNEATMTDLTAPVLGPERLHLQYPFASLARLGARLAMGSDWSVTTADPLAQIEVAVHRTDPAHRDRPPFRPGEALSLEQALTAFTAGSAYVNHDPDGGLIEPGRRADLAVLDRDILAGGRPADARVEFTVVRGEIVYSG